LGRPGVSLGQDIDFGMNASDNPAGLLPRPKRPEAGDARPTAAGALQSMPQGVAAPVRLIWESLIPITLQDSGFRLVDVNPAYLRFTGQTRDKLIGRDPLELQPTRDRVTSLLQRSRLNADVTSTHAPMPDPERLIDASGNERWFRASRSPVTDLHGRLFWVSVLQDCTLEQAERARAAVAENEVAHWFDLSPQGMVLYDDQGQLLRGNRAFETLTGPPVLRLSEAAPGLQQLLAWTDAGPAAQLQPGVEAMQRQAWLPRAGGGARHLRATLRCIADLSGQQRYMAVIEDLQVEEERDLARIQRDALMETAGVGLSTFQHSSGWVRPGLAVGLGASVGVGGEAPATVGLQSISRDLVQAESIPEFERLQQALRQGRRAEVRYGISHPEFGQRWLLTRVEPAMLASGHHSTSVITLDVTEQHLAQQRNEQLLREMSTILENATAGIAYLRGHALVRCNRRFEDMLGLHDVQPGSPFDELFGRHPQGPQIAAQTQQALARGQVFETEFQFTAGDAPGSPPVWYALAVRRTKADEASTDSIAVLSDVTRLKAEQRELEILARERELMFSLSGVGIAYVRQGVIQRANDALGQLAGCSAHQLAGQPLRALFADAEDFERLWPDEQKALRVHGEWLGERPLRRLNGELVWVRVSKRLVAGIDDGGDPDGDLIASYVNVDDRHRAEQAEALQAERTRAILDSVLVGIVTVGPRGIEWMNRSARRMFGGNLADFINQPISTVATPGADHPFRQTQYREELIEGEAETFECRVKARDGREFWVVGNAVATGRLATGRQLTYALMDIERRRQADARIAEAQASLQRIIEAAPLAITLRDARTLGVLQINQLAARMAGLPADQIIGRTPQALYDAQTAETMRGDMRTALASTEVTTREYSAPVDGEMRIWDARYLPLAAPGQPADQLLLVATDVTEQRVAQQAKFEAAIAQREMLVREVHHRIKNNLQGVAGLLQQVAVRKPEVADVISEVVGQVQAIAQVFGLQVGSGGPLRVTSVVEAITGSVQRTFGRNITLSVRGHPPREWALPEAESIPIALTINELLTNAVKHSVPLESGGFEPVACTLRLSDEGVCVEIANRAQLPEGFSLSRYPGGVSGLGLVRALLPRRSASLTMEQHGAQVVSSVLLVPPGVSQLED
jgi:PAS domain S-box-containing protein